MNHTSPEHQRQLIGIPEGIIPTGCLRLDIALGIGGVPRGEFVEISGNISSGKTTLCQHIVAEAQRMGELCAWIDADHTLDPAYAAQCGVNADHLYVNEPGDAEQALQVVEILASSGSMAFVVLDSATSLISHEELKLSLIEPVEISNDRLVSQTLRRLYTIIHKNSTTVIVTNQVRTGISTVYHDLAQHPARLALKLQAALRMELQTLHHIQKDRKIVGSHIQVRIIKNKFAPCFHHTGFDIIYNKGIHRTGEILDLGIHLRIISKRRSNYSYKSQELGSKRSEVLSYLDQNMHIADEIEEIIRQKLLPDSYPAAT